MLPFLGSCLLSVLPLANVAPTPAARAQTAPAQASIFGEPVVVHGRRISDDEIKRYLCMGIGGRDLDMIKFSIMVDQELERRRRDGASAEELARFEVNDTDLERRLAREKEDFRLRYPTLDFALEVGRAEQSLELFRERLRATMRFDRVFRPENPAEWPEITKAVIIENLTEQWLEDERVSYATRVKMLFESQKGWLAEHGFGELVGKLAALPSGDTAAGQPGDTPPVVALIDEPGSVAALAALKEVGLGDIPGDDPIAVDATRGTILQALNSYAIVHIDPDAIAANLPPAAAERARADKVLALIEGVPVLIDQVWNRIAPFVTPDQIDEAKRFLANIALLERDLEAKKLLMTQAEFRAWWPTTAKQGKFEYLEFLNQHEMLSSQVLGFPSLWAFAQHTRVQESYRKSIAEELANDDMLTPSLPIINQIAGASKLNVNVMLLSAYDFDKVRWKDNGWADAKKRALELKKALDEGADWQSTLELHSEFWDPPMPETGNKPMQNFYFKGTFGNQPQTRNQLQGYLGDSDFRTFLCGSSVTDAIFFEQKMGSIDGPYRGSKGYYIARITGKTPPTRPLDLKVPVHREIVVHHYLRNSMNARAMALLREGVEKGDVKGLTLPPPLRDV